MGGRPMKIMDAPSPNHDARPAGTEIDMLVLHYTGMRSGSEAADRLRDPDAKVSAHWLVEEDGTILAMVPEERRAWHAGVSSWRGRTDINARSVGVEIVNPGHEFGYRPFPPAQMVAVADLCLDILTRHPIPPVNVVGHSDVAPTRKQDPGELFDWEGLAAIGIGFWPARSATARAPVPPNWRMARRSLAAIGYGLGPTERSARAALLAFKRRYCPWRVDPILDRETMARIAAVATLLE